MRSPRRQDRKTPEERRFTMIEDRVAAETDVVTKLSRESVAGTVAALDLPLKVLIWADEGQTKVSYYAPAALAASHHLTADLAASLAGINALTDALGAS
jgi:uncharacterized protein (DUF302 family)